MTHHRFPRFAFHRFAVALLALALASPPAQAAADACPASPGSALCSLHEAAGADKAVRGEAEAQRFVILIAADRRLDDGEKLIAKALIDAAEKGSELSLPVPGQAPLRYGVPDKAAADTLRYFLLASPNVERALVPGDDASYRALIAYTARGVYGLNANLIERCAVLLDKDFRTANMLNGFKPYRDRIGDWYQRTRGWTPAEASAAREFLFQCTTRHDDALSGAVPDYLFEWLKP